MILLYGLDRMGKFRILPKWYTLRKIKIFMNRIIILRQMMDLKYFTRHLEMFEWEMRVQAMQNQVFIAMCNRVGTEDKMQFAGESIVIHPGGEVIAKANDQEQLLTCDIDLNEVKKVRNNINYLSLRRPEQYETF